MSDPNGHGHMRAQMGRIAAAIDWLGRREAPFDKHVFAEVIEFGPRSALRWLHALEASDFVTVDRTAVPWQYTSRVEIVRYRSRPS